MDRIAQEGEIWLIGRRVGLFEDDTTLDELAEYIRENKDMFAVDEKLIQELFSDLRLDWSALPPEEVARSKSRIRARLVEQQVLDEERDQAEAGLAHLLALSR